MKLLGLSLGELSTAAVSIDGRIVACASEERFSRRKNDESYPIQAIRYVLKEAGIDGKDLDEVLIAGMTLNLSTHLMHTYSRWRIPDHIKAMREFWKPTLYEKKKVDFYALFKDKLDLDQYPGGFRELFEKIGADYYSKDDWPLYRDFLHGALAKDLGIPKEKIRHLDHHTCHAAYAYWAGPYRGKDVLVMTADAYGDGLSGSLAVPGEDGRLRRLHSVGADDFTLARLYRYITLLLGMEPNAHEYKVMGLAPYAKTQTLAGPLKVFERHMYVDGIEFKFREKPQDYYFWFKERLEGFRFDGIAGALQRYTEDIMTAYAQNALKRFPARRLVFSGGISMNIKLNMLLKDLPGLDGFFVAPSGGDESLAIGACYARMDERGLGERIRPMADSYLGPDLGAADTAATADAARRDGYEVRSAQTETVAGLLAEGRVIGRCVGRMEFGARSLGNRSILADPRSGAIVETINQKIKNRDFWMPFGPSMLAEKGNAYVVNPRNLPSPFMTVGFESTAEGRRLLPAAMHPADKTFRPHFVTKEANPGYHELIEAFSRKSGVAGVVNTSFNLHGEPVVNTAADAYRVFKLTDIDALVIGGTLVLKPWPRGA